MLVERAARFTLKIEHTKKSRFSTYYAIKLDYFLSIVPDEFFLIPLDLISLTEQKKIISRKSCCNFLFNFGTKKLSNLK